MFVSESTLFMGTKLQVLSAEGQVWEAQLDSTATIDAVKRLAIQHFYPAESSSTPDHFRVIYPAESRTLSDSHAIHEEKLKDNDVLLFVRRRNVAVQEVIPDSELKGPTAVDINTATKDLPSPQINRSSTQPSGAHGPHHLEESIGETAVDFQLELRKIIISLISVMATLLHGNSDAELICQEMQSRLNHRLAASLRPIEGTEFSYPPPPQVERTPMGIVASLAEAKKREFRPNVKAFQSLKEMGFGDELIIEALRATKNAKDAACEWILSGKRTVAEDVETGLDQSGHLFNALVTNPIVRLGLNNPKTLLAFLGILESPASANMWLTDADTAPVLSAIFKIYHAEKHAAPDV